MMSIPKPVESRGRDSSVLWNAFEVRFDFPVMFTDGMFAPTNTALVEAVARREADKRHKCLVFVDAGVLEGQPDLLAQIKGYFIAHADRMELVAAPELIAGGEEIKTDPAHLEHLQDRIHATNIDRHSYVIAIGGGAVLDAVGLACATAHRGVRHIRVPTTVLSQNDSGVGVKNAVNFKGIKNYTGTFAPPWAVINDHDFIDALPVRERIAGIAEAVKVALIRDGAFFAWLEQNADKLARFDPEAERYMIRRCAELHIRQISQGGDPFENGSARPLDYGHWSAHKLEAITHHAVRHGEAVAIGLALDTRYSVLCGMLPAGGDDRVADLLVKLGLPIYHPDLLALDADGQSRLLRGLAEFREHLGGELTITLLAGLGTGEEVHAIDADLVAQSIAWLRERASA